MAPTTSRVRTSFDPEHELPRLHQWFAENPHPSRLTLQIYVKELNSLPSRQSRKPLEVHNLCYWFKNARAAYKRAEMRMKRESAEPNQVAANSTHPHHHFSCQPRSQLGQHQQYPQPKSQEQQHHHHHHQLASHQSVLLHDHSTFLPSSLSPASSLSPSGSPPSSLVGGGPLVGLDAELAALKLATAAAAVVPPAAVVKLAATASLKSLLAATGRSLQAPVTQPPVPPLAPFSELDTDRSLYLLLFFMKFFDLDNSTAASWQRTNITQ